MNINSIEPNSHEYREKKTSATEGKPKEKLKPVVDKSALKQESAAKKRFNEVKKTFVRDILIPGLKDTAMDLLGMVFYNDARGGRKYRSGGSYYNYGSSYRYGGSSSYSSYGNRDYDSRKTKKFDYHNIVLNERRDAEEIVGRMRGRIEETGQASLGDLLDLINVPSDFTDDNWGWTDPRDVGVRKVSSGWLVDVSEVRAL